MLGKNSLRVLSGQFKGQKIVSPAHPGTHPMGAREKLALFNLLQPYLAGAKVLDIYAGSGALGIEALSRGADEAVFVEKTPAVARILTQNLQQIAVKGHLEPVSGALPSESRTTAVRTKIAPNAKNAQPYHVYNKSASQFARNSAFWGYFSLILADPPYDGFDISEVAQLPKLLQSGGVFALSFPFATGTPELPELELLTVRHYAAAGIAVYRKS